MGKRFWRRNMVGLLNEVKFTDLEDCNNTIHGESEN